MAAFNSFEKPMAPASRPATVNPNETSVDGSMDVQLSDEDIAMEGDEAGGMELDFGTSEATDDGAFDSNLAESMPESALLSMGSELVHLFDADKDSRKDWERQVTKGFELLGLKTEERTEPWPGASGVYHPVLAETAIQFQAHSIMELFPASGPARTEIGRAHV